MTETVKEGLSVYKAISKVTEALAKAGISKDQKNAQQGYKFRGIDDVYNALAPQLVDAKLVILPDVKERVVEVRETKSGGALYNVTLRVEFRFVSIDDGSTVTVTMYGEAMDSADKATNKALSAAYKYVCLEVFCIPTEGEDNDADKKTPEETKPVSKPALLGSPPVQSSQDAYQQRKAGYEIKVEIMPDGSRNYDAFTADLEIALEAAKDMTDVSMLKKANGKIINAMEKDRPDLYQTIKTEFTKRSSNVA